MPHFIVENLEYLYVFYTFGKLEKNMDMMRKTLVLIVLVCMGLFQLKATVKGELMTLVSEDFSLMAAGSEAEPEAEEISSMDGKIPMEYTNGIQWYGRGVHQAGGSIALRPCMFEDDYGETYEGSGYIMTPLTDVRLDDGNFVVRFKAKAVSGATAVVHGFLYDKWSSNYYMRQTVTITDEWAEYEMNFQHSAFGNHVACVQFASESEEWFFDDCSIEQDVYEISAPIVHAPRDVDFTHFTAQWDKVFTATSYLVSVYSMEGENRVYLFEDKETTDNFLTVEGTVKGGKYFYCVKAKNEKYVSVESDPIEVFVPITSMETPEVLPATDVTATGFTANWNLVYRAQGYCVRLFLKHTAQGDEDFEMLHEDFEKIEDGTLDWPQMFYDTDLNDYAKMPGWLINQGCTVKGMIGLDNFWKDYGDFGMLTSPDMDLSLGDGRYSVKLNVYGKKGDEVYVDSYKGEESVRQSFVLEADGAQSGVVSFENGSDATHFVITFSGDGQLLIDDIFVTQQLKAGDVCTTSVASLELEGEDLTSYRFDDLQLTEGNVYQYAVAAWSWSLDEEGIWGPTVYSEYSELVDVQMNSSIDALSTGNKVYASGMSLVFDVRQPVPVAVYSLGGQLVYSAELNSGVQTLELTTRGLYIVKLGAEVFKVIL